VRSSRRLRYPVGAMRILNVVGPRTLRRELEAKVVRHPNKTWLLYEAADGSLTQLTYAEFARRARRPPRC